MRSGLRRSIERSFGPSASRRARTSSPGSTKGRWSAPGELATLPSPRAPTREMRKALSTPRADEEFEVAVASAKRRNDGVVHGPAERAERLDDARAGLFPHRRIAHDAFLDLPG